MLYLKNTRVYQRVHIPRRCGDDGIGQYSLALREVLGNEVYDAEIGDSPTRSSMYYGVDVALPEIMSRGEYEYILKKGDKVVASGIVQIGDYNMEVADVDYAPQIVSPIFDIEVVEHQQYVDFDMYDHERVDEYLYLGVAPEFVWLDEGNGYSTDFEVVSNVEWRVL